MEEVFVDRVLLCKSCRAEFTFKVGEQRFYEQRKFSQPLRCVNCRKGARIEKIIKGWAVFDHGYGLQLQSFSPASEEEAISRFLSTQGIKSWKVHGQARVIEVNIRYKEPRREY